MSGLEIHAMGINRFDALRGALVADAAALGLHWLYDQARIALIERTGSVLFRQPDANVYEGVKGYFAQAGRHAGQLSHYGESARIVGDVCALGRYEPATHQAAFLSSFGPCGTFCGYADRPTKALVARLLVYADDVPDPSGTEDDQMPGLCPVPAIVAYGFSKEDALMASEVISTDQRVRESVELVYACSALLIEGVPLDQALQESARANDGPVHRLVQEALTMHDSSSQESAMHFGMACHVHQSLPVVWHILANVNGFEEAIQANVLCGGDSCGRAMVLGSLAGLAFGIPDDLLERMQSMPGVGSASW